jgi:hypothetical protein
MWRPLSVFALASLCLTAYVRPAHSQLPAEDLSDIETPLERDSVVNRSRPEYDPIGIPLGAFRAYPTANLDVTYDDNVLRTDTNAQGDWAVSLTPGLYVRSDWVRHYLAARASATRYKYSSLSSENRTEWGATAGGRLDILTGFNLAAAGSYESTFEDRTSRDQEGARRPTPYSETGARAAISYNPFRFGMQLGVAYQRYDYGHTELTPQAGGGERNNDDRDRDVYSMYTTAVYEFSPGYGVFVRPSFEKRVYDLNTGRAAGRDSTGYTIDSGVTLLLTRLITGEAFLGYIHQDLEGANFADLSGVDFGARIQWYPTELLTVHFNASRTPNATTITGASVGDDRYVAVGADYEVLRNVIVRGSLSYTDSLFTGTERRDQDFGARLGVQYLMNRYLTANLAYTRTTRSSTSTGAGFADNTVFLGLRGHL